MLTHSRRTFIHLGALAATGSLVAKVVPAYLEATELSSTEHLVILRARVVPVLSGTTVLGEYSSSVPLAWSQTRISLLSRAQVAVHDSLRELMEGVARFPPVAQRQPPQSSLQWFIQLSHASWRLNDLPSEDIVSAERMLFRRIDSDPLLRADGQAYNDAVKQGVTRVARKLNTTVQLRLPNVPRLDHPHQWLWTSDRSDLNDVSGVDVITNHLAQTFVPTIEELVQRPQHRLATHWHRKSAILRLLKDGPQVDTERYLAQLATDQARFLRMILQQVPAA